MVLSHPLPGHDVVVSVVVAVERDELPLERAPVDDLMAGRTLHPPETRPEGVCQDLPGALLEALVAAGRGHDPQLAPQKVQDGVGARRRLDLPTRAPPHHLPPRRRRRLILILSRRSVIGPGIVVLFVLLLSFGGHSQMTSATFQGFL